MARASRCRTSTEKSVLIAAALKMAKQAGAPALEAYPLDANLTPSSSWTGYASTFERAGFTTVARHVPPRPIMRHDLKKLSSKPNLSQGSS
jgi:hypothetical protein